MNVTLIQDTRKMKKKSKRRKNSSPQKDISLDADEGNETNEMHAKQKPERSRSSSNHRRRRSLSALFKRSGEGRHKRRSESAEKSRSRSRNRGIEDFDNDTDADPRKEPRERLRRMTVREALVDSRIRGRSPNRSTVKLEQRILDNKLSPDSSSSSLPHILDQFPDIITTDNVDSSVPIHKRTTLPRSGRNRGHSEENELNLLRDTPFAAIKGSEQSDNNSNMPLDKRKYMINKDKMCENRTDVEIHAPKPQTLTGEMSTRSLDADTDRKEKQRQDSYSQFLKLRQNENPRSNSSSSIGHSPERNNVINEEQIQTHSSILNPTLQNNSHYNENDVLISASFEEAINTEALQQSKTTSSGIPREYDTINQRKISDTSVNDNVIKSSNIDSKPRSRRSSYVSPRRFSRASKTSETSYLSNISADDIGNRLQTDVNNDRNKTIPKYQRQFSGYSEKVRKQSSASNIGVQNDKRKLSSETQFLEVYGQSKIENERKDSSDENCKLPGFGKPSLKYDDSEWLNSQSIIKPDICECQELENNPQNKLRTDTSPELKIESDFLKMDCKHNMCFPYVEAQSPSSEYAELIKPDPPNDIIIEQHISDDDSICLLKCDETETKIESYELSKASKPKIGSGLGAFKALSKRLIRDRHTQKAEKGKNTAKKNSIITLKPGNKRNTEHNIETTFKPIKDNDGQDDIPLIDDVFDTEPYDELTLQDHTHVKRPVNIDDNDITVLDSMLPSRTISITEGIKGKNMITPTNYKAEQICTILTPDMSEKRKSKKKRKKSKSKKDSINEQSLETEIDDDNKILDRKHSKTSKRKSRKQSKDRKHSNVANEETKLLNKQIECNKTQHLQEDQNYQTQSVVTQDDQELSPKHDKNRKTSNDNLKKVHQKAPKGILKKGKKSTPSISEAILRVGRTASLSNILDSTENVRTDKKFNRSKSLTVKRSHSLEDIATISTDFSELAKTIKDKKQNKKLIVQNKSTDKPARLSLASIVTLKAKFSRLKKAKQAQKKNETEQPQEECQPDTGTFEDENKPANEDLELTDMNLAKVYYENEVNVSLSKLNENKETDVTDNEVKDIVYERKIHFQQYCNDDNVSEEELIKQRQRNTRLTSRRESKVRTRQKKVISCCKSFVAFLFSHIGLCSLVVAYCILGGFIFKKLEGEEELKKKREMRELREEYREKIFKLAFEDQMTKNSRNVFRDEVEKILKNYSTNIHKQTKEAGWDGKDDSAEPEQWSFPSSLLYAITVMTTIGYGHVAPKTDYGRIVTIAYAVLGIPLTLLCLTNIGDVMAKGFRLLYGKVFCGMCCILFRPSRKKRLDPEKGLPAGDERMVVQEEEKSEEVINVPTSVCLLLMSSYIMLGTWLFCEWEQWDMVTGTYFCFITLSTIGFGDVVPGMSSSNWQTNEKLVLCACYLVFGLSLIAMCFNLVQEDVKAKCKWLGQKLGIIDKPVTAV